MESYELSTKEMEASSFTISNPNPNYMITFYKTGDNGFVPQEIGRLDFNGPTMKFEGDLDESAKRFFEYIALNFSGRLKEEYQRGYEDCLTEESKK